MPRTESAAPMLSTPASGHFLTSGIMRPLSTGQMQITVIRKMRSSSFDTTDRFDTGRYDRASTGSRFAFLRSGVTYAALCDWRSVHTSRVHGPCSRPVWTDLEEQRRQQMSDWKDGWETAQAQRRKAWTAMLVTDQWCIVQLAGALWLWWHRPQSLITKEVIEPPWLSQTTHRRPALQWMELTDRLSWLASCPHIGLHVAIRSRIGPLCTYCYCKAP